MILTLPENRLYVYSLPGKLASAGRYGDNVWEGIGWDFPWAS